MYDIFQDFALTHIHDICNFSSIAKILGFIFASNKSEQIETKLSLGQNIVNHERERKHILHQNIKNLDKTAYIVFSFWQTERTAQYHEKKGRLGCSSPSLLAMWSNFVWSWNMMMIMMWPSWVCAQDWKLIHDEYNVHDVHDVGYVMIWPSCVRAEAWEGHTTQDPRGAALKRPPTVFGYIWYAEQYDDVVKIYDDVVKRLDEKIW